MSAGLRSADWAAPLPTGAGQLLQDARGGGSRMTAVAVQGPGGTGKSLLLTRLAAAYRDAGIPVADARTAPAAADLTGDLTILVDDAQRLSPAGAERVRDLLGHPGARVTLAYRPWPRPPALAELVRDMAGDRHMVVLGHLSRDVVQTWATAELGDAATPRLVDFVLGQTGGLPALVAAHAPPERPAPVTFADVPASTPESTALAKALKRAGFRFVGPTTTYALMQAVGVVDDHLAGCPVRAEVEAERRQAGLTGGPAPGAPAPHPAGGAPAPAPREEAPVPAPSGA